MSKTGEENAEESKVVLHTDDPSVVDTYEWFWKEKCDLIGAEKARIDERNFCNSRILDLSVSGIDSLNTAYLKQLRKVTLRECPISELNTENLANLTYLDIKGIGTVVLNTKSLRELEQLSIADTYVESIDTSTLTYLRGPFVYKRKLAKLNTTLLFNL